MTSTRPSPHYDVAVVGGALAGAATALLLRRFAPQARVLVVERQEAFDRKVGEATVEVSAFFLDRVLGLGDHLASEQLPKHGLRFWFTDGPGRDLATMTEVGSRRTPRLPSFQLDRQRLDEEVLARAVAAGCDLARPAKVTAVEAGWPESRLRWQDAAGEERAATARWVVDASGRGCFLARRLGLLETVGEHPTAALWGRWRGVADMDGPAVLGPDPAAPRLPPVAPLRRNATNHFCGYGWWCWVIPLAGGDTSVGLVHDREIFPLPGEGSLAERYRAHVTGQPGLAELLAGAEMVDGDFLAYRHLPYRSTRYAGRGWALVGDAAGFMDPYYSPGLDHLSMSAWATARLVADELAGRLDGPALDRRLAEHDRRFLRSYRRWLDALYLGKYELMGDAEMAVGVRDPAEPHYPALRRLPKAILGRWVSWLVGRRVPDINSGLRVFRRAVAARYLGLLPDGFSFTTTLTLAMLRSGYRVRWVPIATAPRRGRSKIRPVRDTLAFVQLILRTGIYFAPLRMLAPVITALGAAFLVSAGYDVLVLDDVTDKTLILFMFMANTFLFALLADMIDKRSR